MKTRAQTDHSDVPHPQVTQGMNRGARVTSLQALLEEAVDPTRLIRHNQYGMTRAVANNDGALIEKYADALARNGARLAAVQKRMLKLAGRS